MDIDIEKSSRFATALIFFLASIGVVYFHLNGSQFYISYDFGLKAILAYLKQHSFFFVIVELFSGSCAVIGLFLITSGYGLSKNYNKTPAYLFLLNRFKKVYLYSFFMALICTLVVFLVDKTWVFNFWHSFLLLDGFYDKLPRDRATIQYWYLALAFTYYFAFITFRRIRSTGNLLTWSLVVAHVFGICMILQKESIVDFNFPPLDFVSFYHSCVGRFPEFVAGMFLARHRILEDLFFRFSYTRLIFGIVWVFTGYCSFFNQLSYLSSHFIYSTGLFFFLSQLAGFLMRWPSCVRYISFLSGGTFSLYCLHMISIDYAFTFLSNITGNISFPKEIIRLLSDFFIILCCIFILLIGNKIELRYRSVMQEIWPSKSYHTIQ